MLGELKKVSRELGFHRLEAHVDLHNIPSQNLLEQADFYLEGVRKQFQKEGLEWKDRQVFVYILN